MKKNYIILLIIFSLFVFIPNNVLAKEFKQINQIKKNQIVNNYSDTYKLDNGDYIVGAGEYLARITNDGSFVWKYDDLNYSYYDFVVLNDYVYLVNNDLIKIDINDGSVIKTVKNVYLYRIIKFQDYLFGIGSDEKIIKIDQNLNVIDNYNSGDELLSNQRSDNVNISSNDDNIYILNVIETQTGTDTDDDGTTYPIFEYEGKVIKLDSNLNLIDKLPINEELLNYFFNPGQFFTDNNGNLYLVNNFIAKLDKNGNMDMIYMPYEYSMTARPSNYKLYYSGTVVGNYLIFGGNLFELSYDDNGKGIDQSIKDIKPIVEVYNLNYKLIENHELIPDNNGDNFYTVNNITKTSNNGFIAKWYSTSTPLKNADIFKNVNPFARELNTSGYLPVNDLYTTEFAKVVPIKVNVKGLGNVKIKNGDCTCGDLVELDVTPKAGYYLKSLVVRNSAGKKIEVKNNKFVMPCDGGVTVDAQFREINNPKTSSIIILSIVLIVTIFGCTIIARKRVKG